MRKSTVFHSDVSIIGGGFYGCCLALLMRGYFDNVVIFEKEEDLLKRASSINQARIHAGYHYPRSLVTAYRSFINFPRFVFDFRSAVIGDFIKIYAIARKGSKVNSSRFFKIYKEMDANIKIAEPNLKKIFSRELIEEVFCVEEMAFDASILREILREKLEKARVKIIYGREVKNVKLLKDSNIDVHLYNSEEKYKAKFVFNCTYSQINKVLKNSGIAMLPLKHELTEMPLIKIPLSLKKYAVTVMDGPFFSIMPYPSRKLHSIHHVRYTPHFSWTDQEKYFDGHFYLSKKVIQSNFNYMIKDIQRYIPSMKEADYMESLYEIKTVLIKNEVDDGRPILLIQDKNNRNFTSIMGSKIDNIYDILDIIVETKEKYNLKKNIWRYLFQN